MKSSAVMFTNLIEPDLSTASSGISLIVTLTTASTQWNGTIGSFSSVTCEMRCNLEYNLIVNYVYIIGCGDSNGNTLGRSDAFI